MRPETAHRDRDVTHSMTESRRLLVVDDERIQRMIVTRGVGALGFQADAAATLDEASALLGRHGYDAVLLDLSLGESEGISLLQAVRDNVADPAVIFISALDQRVRSASTRLAASLGVRVAGALHKPVAQAELAALLGALPVRAPSRPGAVCPAPGLDELAQAVHGGEIAVQFQPKVRLADGHVAGMEALARWQPAGGGMVSPDIFVPMAEENGLIVPLTLHVLRHALACCRRWRAAHPACSVAVNFSPLVLADPALPDAIDAALRESGLGPGALVAEITEGTVIRSPVIAAEVLTRLRIKGISLSIDDFGTGHSSLLTLLRLPFSELKIDRSFVAQCDTDAEAWKIVRAIVSMARELGLTVVAEGIERQVIADMLRSIGCHLGQGWLFGRAMEEPALHEWLAACRPGPP